MSETLNTGPADAAAPSATDTTTLPTGPVPTIFDEEHFAQQEASSPAAQEEEDKGAAKAAAEDETKGKTEPAKEEAPAQTEEAKITEPEETRYDKIPRFQELQRKVKESGDKEREAESRAYRAEAQADLLMRRLEAIERNFQSQQHQSEYPANLDERTLEEIAEREGIGKAVMLAAQRAKEDARREVLDDFNERTTTDRLTTDLKSFASDNADFMQMFESGELARIADSSPLYNTPVAAYLKVRLDRDIQAVKDQFQTELQTAIDKARQEERDVAAKKLKEMEANFKAKKSITVVEERASSPTGQPTPIESGGDIRKALYRRHLERQNSGV